MARLGKLVKEVPLQKVKSDLLSSVWEGKASLRDSLTHYNYR
jgi:hypothetical protein